LAPLSALGDRLTTAFVLGARECLEIEARFAFGGLASLRGLWAADRLMAFALADFFSGGRPRAVFFECVAKTLRL